MVRKMSYLNRLSLIAATFLVTASAVHSASATDAPADVCSLLPAAEVSKILGQAYDSPQKSVAPRPFGNTVTGTDCRHRSLHSKLLFRAYFDPSPSAAVDLFAKLSKFYGTPTPISGLGDAAYFDEAHGLHVRKGNVRFYINLDPIDTFTPAMEKQLVDLAGRVSGRL